MTLPQQMPWKKISIHTNINNQLARKPPSMGRVVPLTIALWSLNKKSIGFTISSTSVIRTKLTVRHRRADVRENIKPLLNGHCQWIWEGGPPDGFSTLRNTVQINTPANLPIGIRPSIGPAFFESDHPSLPISVITTVGLTAFTRICKYKEEVDY